MRTIVGILVLCASVLAGCFRISYYRPVTEQLRHTVCGTVPNVASTWSHGVEVLQSVHRTDSGISLRLTYGVPQERGPIVVSATHVAVSVPNSDEVYRGRLERGRTAPPGKGTRYAWWDYSADIEVPPANELVTAIPPAQLGADVIRVPDVRFEWIEEGYRLRPINC